MNEELKPCPFCGDDGYIMKYGGITCATCGASVKDTKTWNTRQIEDALLANLAVLRAELAALRAELATDARCSWTRLEEVK